MKQKLDISNNKKIALGASIVVILIVVIISLIFINKSDKADTTGSTFEVEPVATEGADPYMELVRKRQQEQPTKKLGKETTAELRNTLSQLDELVPTKPDSSQKKVARLTQTPKAVVDNNTSESQSATEIENDEEALQQQIDYKETVRDSYAAVDEKIISIFLGISNQDKIDTLIENNDLVQRFVLLVDNIARGVINSKHSPLKKPEEKFYPKKVNGKLLISDENFVRFTPYIDLLEALPANFWIEMYKSLMPLMDEAYEDLGYTENFSGVKDRAIQNILSIKPPLQDIEVHRPSVAYHYKDVAMQELNDVEKQLYRLGPYNTTRLQLFIKKFASELEQSNP